jgi:hypothetical protein
MSKRRTAGKVAPSGADQRPEVGPELNDEGQLPLTFRCLAVEGMPTSDGRTIAPDALGHRALPISILAQYTNPGQQGGHAGAEVIGHLTELWRTPGPEVTSLQTGEPFPEGTFVWQGRGVADPETTGGKLVAKGHLRGNSVDLSDVDYDESFADDGKAQINISRGVIAATTLCPIPAFGDAYVQVGDDEELTEPDADALEADLDSALVAAGVGPLAVPGLIAEFRELMAHPLPMFRSADLGDECGPCLAEVEAEWTEVTNADGTVTFSPTVEKRRRAYARGLAMKGEKSDGSDASYPIENQADLDKAAGMVGLGKASDPKIKAHIAKAARKLGLKTPQSLKADGAPTLPALAVFSDPGFTAYTPLVIGDPRPDGRREVLGHIAPWNECHVGYSGQCVRPPHSRTDYARFATGAARCVDEDGTTRIAAIGHISMSRDSANGGHAPNNLSEADTVAFYDNQCTAVADVAAGEDAHGIWVHGLTASDVTDAEVDRLLASPPSGDWRAYRGNLELCAILVVNTPGYVVARSRVASGEPVSLVAAGHADAVALAEKADTATETTLRAMLREELAAHGLTRDTGSGDTTVVPLADRKAAALRSIRRGAALAEITGPFDAAR